NVRSYWNPDSTVGIVQIGTEVPVEYSLSQNYPNPFNPVTKINFAIPKAGMVTIKLYDILGREVSRLVNEFKAAGTYTIDFNAGNLSSGVYFYRMETSGFNDIKKMMILK
ncbi:MAG TPA: T9SS type A sorting domain-containing protein, partial [Ignavibacteria bacterium]|nr:T9SS type A sorting domain-containing protein [Ignavibacteria bacterium]